MATFEQAMKAAFQAGFAFATDDRAQSFDVFFAEHIKQATALQRVAKDTPAAVIAARYGDKAQGTAPGMVQVIPIAQPDAFPTLDDVNRKISEAFAIPADLVKADNMTRIAKYAEGGSFADFTGAPESPGSDSASDDGGDSGGDGGGD